MFLKGTFTETSYFVLVHIFHCLHKFYFICGITKLFWDNPSLCVMPEQMDPEYLKEHYMHFNEKGYLITDVHGHRIQVAALHCIEHTGKLPKPEQNTNHTASCKCIGHSIFASAQDGIVLFRIVGRRDRSGRFHGSSNRAQVSSHSQRQANL
eukprot:Phypoly_transcript_13534.p1 GENE.Phypoly_transcript_13534~~Phypoly_transcript_13534.p1  ORF type:complete len:152 (+),score=11.30 Phypoly_transcript_13534:304-759(+)